MPKEVGRDLFDGGDLEGRVCFKHVETEKVHVLATDRGETVPVFRCGRVAGERYQRVRGRKGFSVHGCLTCFRVVQPEG